VCVGFLCGMWCCLSGLLLVLCVCVCVLLGVCVLSGIAEFLWVLFCLVLVW
jgi:hypothetical protein